MKRNKIPVLSLVAIFLLAACTVPVQTQTSFESNLIPYKDSNRLFGYMNEETGEIIIEAQYSLAGPFIGNFAVVEIYNPRQRYQQSQIKIINQDNDEIYFGDFYKAKLYSSEDEKTVIAVLTNMYERTRIAAPWWWPFILLFGGNWSYEETIFKERLVNLTTEKTIIHQKEQFLKTEVIGEYFTVDRKKLYRFLDNGSVQLVASDATRAAAILDDYLKERGINASVTGDWEIGIDFRPYIDEKYSNPDFTKAFEKLRPDFDIPFQRSIPLYRDPKVYLNTSIEITGDRRYLMRFRGDGSLDLKDPFSSAEGIYNETREEWEIMPYLFFDNAQYVTDTIAQTNNPHLFELRMKKVLRDHAPSYTTVYMIVNTMSEKPVRYGLFDTNQSGSRIPFRGGIYYYIDLSQE